MTVHVSVVLDRSGSMASIADDMVGGFNEFLARQRTIEGEARVTLVQFDGEDPFEVLIDGVPLREVIDLDRARYVPRGTTPLYDAIGRMIGRNDADIARRHDFGAAEEDQVVVIVTDGQENASGEHTRASVFDMVTERQDRGWVFVFLGADQDSYAEGGHVGVAAGHRVGWEKTPDGSSKLWRDVSHSTEAYRRKDRQQRRSDSGNFYEEDPDGDSRR